MTEYVANVMRRFESPKCICVFVTKSTSGPTRGVYSAPPDTLVGFFCGELEGRYLTIRTTLN